AFALALLLGMSALAEGVARTPAPTPHPESFPSRNADTPPTPTPAPPFDFSQLPEPTIPPEPNGTTPPVVSYPLTLEEAARYTLFRMRLKPEDVHFIQLANDQDDGFLELEVAFLYDGLIHAYEFAPEDGKILRETTTDIAKRTPSLWQGLLDGKYITIEQAIQKAMERANLKGKEVQLISAELDMDDGFAEYDVVLFADNWTYTVELDAETGAVREYETERGWDD
ncbi:MAG: PepSY domain-containing protein, partial [Oscillospiraceae bacterium]|nr:PepSY domain-containing protein [Oscillospiraceae bacterium]